MFQLLYPEFPISKIEIEHEDLTPIPKMSVQNYKVHFTSIREANEYIQNCIKQKCINQFNTYKVLLTLNGEEKIFLTIPHNQFLIKMPFLIEQFAMRSILQSALEGSLKLSTPTINQIANIHGK